MPAAGHGRWKSSRPVGSGAQSEAKSNVSTQGFICMRCSVEGCTPESLSSIALTQKYNELSLLCWTQVPLKHPLPFGQGLSCLYAH